MVREGKPFSFTSSYAPARLIPSTDATSGTESISGSSSNDLYFSGFMCFLSAPAVAGAFSLFACVFMMYFPSTSWGGLIHLTRQSYQGVSIAGPVCCSSS